MKNTEEKPSPNAGQHLTEKHVAQIRAVLGTPAHGYRVLRLDEVGVSMPQFKRLWLGQMTERRSRDLVWRQWTLLARRVFVVPDFSPRSFASTDAEVEGAAAWDPVADDEQDDL